MKEAELKVRQTKIKTRKPLCYSGFLVLTNELFKVISNVAFQN
jgi:hypothetical protein